MSAFSSVSTAWTTGDEERVDLLRLAPSASPTGRLAPQIPSVNGVIWSRGTLMYWLDPRPATPGTAHG